MSIYTWGTLSLFVFNNVVAVGWTAWILRHGIAPGWRAQARSSTAEAWRGRMPLTALNMLLLLASTAAGIEALSGWITPAWPGALAVAAQILFLLLVDDAWFYVFHRVAHENKWLYQRIHRIHHRAYAPLPTDYLYVHPAEWALGGFGVVLGLGALTLMQGSLPLWVFAPFAAFRNLHEVAAHAGRRSTWLGRLPLVAPTEHHDRHHAQPSIGNYASTFLIWDRLFRTESPAPAG